MRYISETSFKITCCLQDNTLRGVYQKFLKEKMAELREEHPTWTGMQIITEARKMSGPQPFIFQKHDHHKDIVLTVLSENHQSFSWSTGM